MRDVKTPILSFEELSLAKKRQCARQINTDIINRSVPGVVMTLTLWFIVAFFIDNQSEDPETSNWLYFFSLLICTTSAFRIGMFFYAKRIITKTTKSRLYILIGLAVGCLAWGIMAASSFLDTPLAPHENTILLATVGLAAGGAVAFSLSRLFTYVYISCILIPIIIVELFFTAKTDYEIVMITSLYFIGLAWVTINLNKEYMSALVSNLQLTEISNTDSLTGIYNRRYFDRCLYEEVQRTKRNDNYLALLILDIDHFKSINDQYGHLVGDQCLVAVAECLKYSVNRVSDTVARYGGEEFAVILSNTNPDYCRMIAEKLRESVSKKEIRIGDKILKMTISVGACVTQINDKNYKEAEMIAKADEALYRAKENGRDRVEIGSAA